MKLTKNNISKRDEPIQLAPIEVGFGDNGTAPFFKIHRKTEAIAELARKESVDPEQPYRTEKGRGFDVRRVPNIRDDVFMERMVFHLIAGWSELTTRNIFIITDPSKSTIKFDGNDEQPIEYTDEAKELICSCADDTFRAFILQVSMDNQIFFHSLNSEQEKN